MLMSYGWINAEEYSINTLMLMDRWIINVLARNSNPEFRQNLAVSLAYNPAVHWYAVNRCLERKEYYDSLVKNAPEGLTEKEVRDAEIKTLDELDWAVVYVYPELMDKLPYIVEWDSHRLLSMADFTGKTVLDIGSGTGRLALAAATQAKVVYASEPVDRLREYLREKVKGLGLDNVYVIDGMIESIPFHEEYFDIVTCGHSFGDDYNGELREMMRVTKPGGYIIDCPGEEFRTDPGGPKQELIRRGFEYSHYVSKLGGDVYRYRKQVF